MTSEFLGVGNVSQVPGPGLMSFTLRSAPRVVRSIVEVHDLKKVLRTVHDVGSSPLQPRGPESRAQVCSRCCSAAQLWGFASRGSPGTSDPGEGQWSAVLAVARVREGFCAFREGAGIGRGFVRPPGRWEPLLVAQTHRGSAGGWLPGALSLMRSLFFQPQDKKAQS